MINLVKYDKSVQSCVRVRDILFFKEMNIDKKKESFLFCSKHFKNLLSLGFDDTRISRFIFKENTFVIYY